VRYARQDTKVVADRGECPEAEIRSDLGFAGGWARINQYDDSEGIDRAAEGESTETKMKTRTLAIRLVILFALMPGMSALCQCTPTSTEKTTWGGNTNAVMQEPKPMRSIHGIVEDQVDKPLTGVLVEVYDHPEIVLQNPSSDRAGQRRIAACITNETGLFSLDVPPGHYELRLSKSSEWNVTSIPVRVTKSAPSSKKDIVVRLLLGQ
jgi:hypothetical protein